MSNVCSKLFDLADKATSRDRGEGLRHLQRPEVAVRPAASFEQLCQAFHLVYREYLKCGYQSPCASQMRYSALQLLPSSRTFVATRGHHVIGTGTVVLASQAGLPSSEIFGDVFYSMEASGRKVAEGTLLACTSIGDVPASSVSLQIIPCAISWALTAGTDDWCVVSNPKHLKFWRDTLGFDVLAESRPCDHVGGHPGILLRLPLRELRQGLVDATTHLASRVLEELPQVPYASPFQLMNEEVAVLLARQPELLQHISSVQRKLIDERFPMAIWSAEQSYFSEETRTAA